jgi:PAS domain S-box-containing protein
MAKQNNPAPDLAYRNLFTALPESYLIFNANDPAYTIVDVNPAHAKLTLTRAKDIIGKPLFDTLPNGSDKDAARAIRDMRRSILRVIRTQRSRLIGVVRYDATDRNGMAVERYIRTELLPILDADGQVAFIIQTSENVTDEVLGEQRLQQVEHRLSDALAIGNIGSWVWNIPNDTVVGDATLGRILGIGANQAALGIAYKAFTNAIHPDDRERVVADMSKTLISHKPYNNEYRTFGSDGQIHWVIARGRLELNQANEPLIFAGVIVDITDRKQAEQIYQRQSRFIETITRSIGEGIYSVDKNGLVTFINDAAQNMLGYRSREMVGKNIHEMVHYRRSGSKLPKTCTIHKTILSGKIQAGEDYFIDNSRTVFPISYTSAPMIDASGEVEGGVVVFADITAQKRNEDILRYQSLIVGSIDDAIVSASLQGRVTGWNAAAHKLTGYTEKQALGKPLESILKLDKKYDIQKIRAYVQGHGVWRGKVTFKSKSAQKIEVLLTMSLLKNKRGEPIGRVSVLQDLTAIRTAQAAAEAARVRAQTNKILADNLQKRNEELVLLNRTKDEFIALASHQLRTPATGVKQYLGMVLNGFSDPLTPGQQNFLERAYACNERPLRIVEDILRVAQVDLDKVTLHIQPTDMCELVRDIVDTYGSTFDSRKQKVTLVVPDTPVMAHVDRERLRMAIDNIIDNASKYTPAGRSINIELSRVPAGGCQLSIADHGVGIRQGDLTKLFQKFSRLDNPLSIEVGGSGLGLYWSKKVIGLHGGDIVVTSRLNRGSTFTVHLPQKASAKQ